LGLGTFLVTMAVFFVRTLRAAPGLDEERQSWLVGIQSGVIAALAVGLLDHYYFNIEFSHMAALFWGLVGCGMAVLSLDAERAPAPEAAPAAAAGRNGA
ncbi:MAG TPA: hypothetical protein VLA19_06595, partial [Herpetosiphonaceae bacterium]|nr:hypothetical protein [Herpetosiphonaceae bacterium]